MSESGMCEKIYMGGWVHECTLQLICLDAVACAWLNGLERFHF